MRKYRENLLLELYEYSNKLGKTLDYIVHTLRAYKAIRLTHEYLYSPLYSTH